MKYLVTGGCGFVGSNLALKVLNQKEDLYILDNLYRLGSQENLKFLKKKGEFNFIHSDIRNYNDVENTIREIKPDVIFHLAGQVAMTTSLENPRLDFEVNAMGTHNLLESVRKYSPKSIIVYSSTNKVYGDLEYLTYKEKETRYVVDEYPNGFDESMTLDFHSPYGCSKGTADQYLLDYSRMFGLRTVVLRHSSMYGINQHSTFDQGWIGWFCQKGLDIKNQAQKEKFTISGNGKQVRDVLYADDVVNCYFKLIDNIEKVKGQAFNIGGGIENSLSLLELFDMLEQILEIKMEYIQLPVRESDQKVFVSDNKKINNYINWKPLVSKEEGITKIINWINTLKNKDF